MERAARRPAQSDSSVSFSPTSSRAMSASSSAFSVIVMRACPSVPSSSKPAVSINTAGPMPGSSIALRTGSVVVPAMSDTSDTCCEARRLTTDDLPLLHAPSTMMCSLLAEGVSLSVMRCRCQKRKSRWPRLMRPRLWSVSSLTREWPIFSISELMSLSPLALTAGEA